MANLKNTTQGIYIELDCLLDTRLGTCRRIDESNIGNILSSGYHKRKKDEFPNIDKETFNDLYKKRNVLTLSLSNITNVVKILNKIIKEYFVMLEYQPLYTSMEIFLNIYPYKLNKEELDEIVLCLKYWTDNLVPITVINKDNKNLTVKWVYENIDTMFKYDYDDWLDSQVDNFKLLQLNDVHLLSPAIYLNGEIPTEEEESEAISDIGDRDVVTSFNAVEKMARPLIDLNLIDVSNFSIIEPKTLSNI